MDTYVSWPADVAHEDSASMDAETIDAMAEATAHSLLSPFISSRVF